ncbi:MAG TPA: nuclear transport factor 2 family protein [Streptomyces sp.]|nr:nuclear transport factor 2 family protein [Streptomyces sp.]
MSEIQKHPDVETVLRYLRAVSRFATGAELASFFHEAVVHRELPNLLLPDGAVRDLAAIKEAAESGRKVVSEQTFEVVNAVAADGRVALEAVWTGTLAVKVGELPAGHVLRAHIASFLELREGRIAGQRSYDCYEPIGSA